MGLISKTLKRVDQRTLARNHARAAKARMQEKERNLQKQVEQCEKNTRLYDYNSVFETPLFTLPTYDMYPDWTQEDE